MTLDHAFVDNLARFLVDLFPGTSSRAGCDDITISDVPEKEFGVIALAINDYVSSNNGILLSERRTNLTHDVAYRFADSLPTSITATYGPKGVRISVRDLH